MKGLLGIFFYKISNYYLVPTLEDGEDIVSKIRQILGIISGKISITFTHPYTNICVLGESGVGNTSTLAYWYFTHADLFSIYHTIHGTIQPSTASVLEGLRYKIERRLKISSPKLTYGGVRRRQALNEQSLIKWLLERAFEQNLAGSIENPFIFIIDALDEGEEGLLEALVSAIPSSFQYRLLLSCHNRWREDILSYKPMQVVELKGLRVEDAKNLLLKFSDKNPLYETEWKEILKKAEYEQFPGWHDPEYLVIIGNYLREVLLDESHKCLDSLPQKRFMKHRFLFDLYTRIPDSLRSTSLHNKDWETNNQEKTQSYFNLIKDILSILAVVPEGLPKRYIFNILVSQNKPYPSNLADFIEHTLNDINLVLPVLQDNKGIISYNRREILQSFLGFFPVEFLDETIRIVIEWCEKKMAEDVHEETAWALRNLPSLYQAAGRSDDASSLLRSPRFLELRTCYAWKDGAKAIDASIDELYQLALEGKPDPIYHQRITLLTPECQGVAALCLHRERLLKNTESMAFYLYNCKYDFNWKSEASLPLSIKKEKSKLICPSDGYPEPKVGHSAPVSALSLSADGIYLFSGGYDNTLRLWHLETREPLEVIKGEKGDIWTATMHPNARLAISGSFDGSIQIWDLLNYKCIGTMKGHESSVLTVAIHPDGGLIVSGGEDGKVCLWDLHRRECLEVMEGHEDFVWAVSIHPNGRVAISGSEDKTIRIWDLVSRKCLGVMSGQESEVISLAVHPGGRFALSGSRCGTLCLWDLRKCECLGVMSGHEGKANSVVIHREGRLAYSGGDDGMVCLWDLKTMECLKTVKLYDTSIRVLAIHPDSRFLLAGTEDGSIHVLDFAQEKTVGRIRGVPQKLTCSVSNTKERIGLSGCEDHTLRVLDIVSQKCIGIIDHNSPVTAVAIHPEGGVGFSGDKDNSLLLWDIMSKKKICTLTEHKGPITSIEVHPDGKRVITGSRDRRLCIWDLTDEKLISTMSGHEGEVYITSIHPKGDRLVSGGEDKNVILWSLEDHRIISVMKGHDADVRALVFHPYWLISGGKDGLIIIWNQGTYETLKILKGHEKSVNAIAVHPNGGLALSGGDDLCLRLWDLETGEIKRYGFTDSPIHSIAFISSTQVSVGTEDSILIWELDKDL